VASLDGIRVEAEIVRSCPICGGNRLAHWRRSHDRSHFLSTQRFTYSRCRECGLRFESVRPPESEIASFYPDAYYGPLGAAPCTGGQSSRPVRRRARAALDWINAKSAELLPDPLPARLAAVYQPPGEGSVFLDYGCGSSTFLDRASRQGWRTIGADISTHVLQEVRERGHQTLSADPGAWVDLPNESVRLVRVNHVIEHLYSPRTILSALFRKLERGGILHVATPNPVSVGSILLRARWLGLDCPRHVMLYPPKVLASLLRDIGFRRVEVEHEVLTKDLARSLGNVLYDAGRIEREDILAMADRATLEALLQAPARLAARLGASDRFHAFAER
jgi:2-polyprenyl-3-methyl-5-hydroxy-6-metoxy-1,4-benzoquinol methylase